MNNSRPSGRGELAWQMATVFVLVTGCLAIWAVATGWLTGVVTTWMRRDAWTASQSLSVQPDGTALIMTQSRLPKVSTTYHTLEGQTVDVDHDGVDFISSAWLRLPGIPSRRSPQLDWSNRILATTDGRQGNYWYLVHNGRGETGRAYVVGYDPLSGRRIGFLGTQGFRQSAIPAAEQFSVDGRVLRESEMPGFFPSNGDFPLYYALGTLRGRAYLVSDAVLWELDLRRRTVRRRFPDLRVGSVGLVVIPADQFDHPSPKQPDAKGPATLHSTMNAVALRAEDRVILFDPGSERDVRLRVPEALRDEGFDFYSLVGRRGLAIRGAHILNGNGTRDLTWFDSEGNVEREQRVQLESYEGQFSFSGLNRTAALAMPSPLGQLAYVTSALPDQVQIRQPTLTYCQSLVQAVGMAWPQAMVILAVSGIAAGIAVQWQRRFHRPHTACWAALVFLLGPLGLLAYWLYFPRPPEEPCEHCGEVVPVNRDVCVACQQEFPPAPLHGTEIFA